MLIVAAVSGCMEKSPTEIGTNGSELSEEDLKICSDIAKSNQPLLEAFIVSQCPFGLQMQRIMAEMISELPQCKDYLKVGYIGSIANDNITSMHGNEEAEENLRQICIRDEQSDKYWDYINCYMKEGKSADCLKNVSVDHGMLGSCINESSRGLAYAQKDFDLANEFRITASPTLMMNGKTVNEFDFATNTTDGRSPEALKEILCCGFKNKPTFCSEELNKTKAKTMFEVNVTSADEDAGPKLSLTRVGEKNPSQAMLLTDENINLARLQYPLLVVDAFSNGCDLCKLMNVTIDELSGELQGQVAFGFIDMDRNNKTKANYNITDFPTLLIFKYGKLVNSVIGNQKKSSVVAELKEVEPELNTSKVKIVGYIWITPT